MLKFRISTHALFLISILSLTLMTIFPAMQSYAGEHADFHQGIALSAEESEWIKSHPVINVRISRDYPPFEFYEEGKFQGVAYDYLKLISQRTGLKFQPTADMPWGEALQRIEDQNGVDLILLITYSKERESFLRFTQNYISYPDVIFTRKDKLFVAGLKDLEGHVVATENDFIKAEMLNEDVSDVIILETETTEEALKAVATGKADAYIGNLAVGSYLIDKLGLVDLKIAAPTIYQDDSYAMGIRKDWPQLASILQKSLDSLTAEELHDITNKWFVLRYEHGLNYKDILTWVIVVMLAAAAIIIYLQRIAAKKIRQSEERFRSIIEDQTEFIVRWRPDGVRTFVNDSYCRCFQQPREKLLGTSFLPLVSEEDRTRVMERISSLSPENPVIIGEHKVILPNGDVGWQSWTDRAIFDANGKLVEYQSVGRDITQQRIAQQQLKDNEEYFRTIFQTCPDTIVLVRSADGVIIDVNDNGLQEFGFSREDLALETSSVNLKLWADPGRREHFVKALEEKGQVDNLEASFCKRNGETFAGLISARQIMFQDEPCHLAFIKNISALKETTQALEKSEAMFRKLSQEFEAVLDGIIDSLILLDPGHTVIWGNKGAARQFGIAQEDLVGKTCHQLWDCQEDGPCGKCVQEVFQTGNVKEVMRTDMHGKSWGVKGYPVFDTSNKVVNVIQISSDLSEKILLREEAARASHLAALGSLSAGIAHEINNPTGLVLVALPFVKDAIKDLLPIMDDYVLDHPGLKIAGLPYATFREEILQTIEDMYSGVQRVKRIVEDLKDFAREKSGEEDQWVDLQEMIKKGLRLLQNVVKNNTDVFVLEIEDNLPSIKGSSQRLEQVLVNLVQNACQSLESRGKKVTLKAWSDMSRHKVLLQVIDEGCGIPGELIEKITDPFFTTRREVGGTGLGLSVSTRIIEEHGGTLSIDSKVGKGSTFTVELPIDDGGDS